MLTKCKITIHTDVVFVSASQFSIGDGIIESSPAHWMLVFSRESQAEHNYGLPYERYYTFATKPTRKQISKARRTFKVGYDMYEHY